MFSAEAVQEVGYQRKVYCRFGVFRNMIDKNYITLVQEPF
jgi:hypothetical protein